MNLGTATEGWGWFRRVESIGMKRFFIGLSVIAAGGAIALLLMASRYESKIRPGTRVGIVDVGGLVPADAAKKLRVWWESEKLREISLTVKSGRKAPLKSTVSRLGVRLDDQGSVADLPMDDFWVSTARSIGQGEAQAKQFDAKLTLDDTAAKKIDAYVKESVGDPKPAKVSYKDGVIVRLPEVSGYSVDREAFLPAIIEGLKVDGTIQIPIQEAPKKLPDEELAKITDVVSEYTTNFPSGQVGRSENLRIASGKIDGVVLMPGEVFSFNQTVGQRTIEDGYKVAGIYKNGKHAKGLAGGICQVSGTLYNAVLLGNLKVKERRNHSMPVAYLPVGRDATVDYGSADLKFENNTDHPIALYSKYIRGKLTFGVLGKKDPGLQVKLLTSGHKSWSRGVQYVVDPKLPAGKTKVVEKGSSGHSIDVYRIVIKNGVEVAREYLGHSKYVGGVRIVARGPSVVSSASTAPPVTSTSGAIPPP